MLNNAVSTRRSLLGAGLCVIASRHLTGETRYVERSAFSAPASGGLSKWRHGSLVSVEKRNPAAPTFTLAGANGAISSQFTFALPSVNRIWVHDFDLDVTGAVVFCGKCYSSEGQLAPYVAIRPLQGEKISVIRTAPFVAYMVSVAPDATIYTVGLESVNGHPSGEGSNPNGDVVRRFDRSGGLIRSAFPRLQLSRAALRTESGYLAVTSNRVGWYSPVDGEGVYVEMSPDLRSSKVYAGLPSSLGFGMVLGFALTESGGAYLTYSSYSGSADRPTFTLDRQANRWAQIPLPTTVGGEASWVLKGEENGMLVLRGERALHFVAPVNE